MAETTGLHDDLIVSWESEGRIPVLQGAAAAVSKQGTAKLLDDHGVVVFRGFELEETSDFEAFVRGAVPGDGTAVPYREPATPRHHVGGDVYSATDLDRRFEIFFHGENAHVLRFPRLLVFWCRRPAERGGSTILSDCAQLAAEMQPDLKQRWAEVGVQYERRFGFGLGFSWEKVFGSADRGEVDAYLEANRMVGVWEGDALRVRYNRWAVVQHPVSGRDIWFNNFAFYHPATLQESMHKMAGRIGYDRMPHAARWGDGTEVASEVADEVVALYRRCALTTRWEQGDVMVVDNLRMAHGRDVFEGERDVAVLMLEELSAGALGVPAGLLADAEPVA